MTFRYVDVCSGYSAASLAFQGFDWKCAGYAEIDPFAAAIIAHHWGGTAPMRMPNPLANDIDAKEAKRRAVAINSIPNYYWGDRIPNFGDFTTIQEEDVGPVDLLIGGTPCQSFSQAGKRLGLDDPRGNLTLEFLALARRIRPRWLAWENVFGFLSHDEGRTPGTFLGLLGELGYGWAYRVLDAQFIRVDGHEGAVPQRRRRVIVVGCLGNPTAAATVLFDPESLRGNPRPRRRAGQAIAGTIRASAGKRGGIQDEADAEGLVLARDVAPTLDASFGRLQGCSGQDLGHGHGHLVAMRMQSFGEYVEDEVAGTIKARDRLGRETDLVVEPDVAAPLRAGGEQSGWRNDLDNGTFTPVAPEVAGTLSAERARTAAGDGSDATMIVVPFDTTQITSPCNGSNPQVGDPCHSLAKEGHPPVVAFKPSHYTRDKDGAPSEIAPPLTADTDKGDQDTVLLVQEPMALQHKAGGDSMPYGPISPTLEAGGGHKAPSVLIQEAVGFNSVQDPDVSGEISGPLNAQMPQAQAIAFQERGRPEGRAIEVQEDVAYALLSPAEGGRRSEMNICDGWRVRRLTPVECERLQGTPDFYTHILLKKRQRTKIDHELAEYWLSQRPELTENDLRYLCADSPRYRVLGNSYAVNFVRWVAHGIRDVDRAVFG